MTTPNYSRLMEEPDADEPNFAIASGEYLSSGQTPAISGVDNQGANHLSGMPMGQQHQTNTYDPYGDRHVDGDYPMVPLGHSVPPQQFTPPPPQQQQFIPNHGPNENTMPFPTRQPPPYIPSPQPTNPTVNLGDLRGTEFEHYIHQRQYRLDVSQLLDDAWKAYKGNYVQLISYMFLIFILIIFIAICMVVIIFTQINYETEYYRKTAQTTLISKSMVLWDGKHLKTIQALYLCLNLLPGELFDGLPKRDEYDSYQEEELSFSTPALVGILILQLILLSVIPAMMAGLYVGLFQHIRGENIKFSNLLSGLRRIGAVFTIEVISVILNEIHFVLGFYGALSLAYVIPLCLEHTELGFFTSIGLSFRMAHRDITNNIILSLVCYCLLTIGSLLFFISYPMAYFMYGFAYLYIFGLQGVVVVAPQQQTA